MSFPLFRRSSVPTSARAAIVCGRGGVGGGWEGGEGGRKKKKKKKKKKKSTLPRWMITTTARCLRRKCPFFGTSCFVHGSRRKAEAANIVVTNHSLLFCDLAADGGLLPPIRYWVVDEAHSAESEARRAFSLELAEEDILSLARRVASEESRRNVFVRAERTVVMPGNESSTTLFYGLTGKARRAGAEFGEAAQAFCKALPDLFFYDTNKRSKGYETVDLCVE